MLWPHARNRQPAGVRLAFALLSCLILGACGPAPTAAPLPTLALRSTDTARPRPTARPSSTPPASPTSAQAPSDAVEASPTPRFALAMTLTALAEARDTVTPDLTAALLPTSTFVPGSPESIVAQAFAAYINNDEATLTQLYNPEAADLCKAGYGSIAACIGFVYKTHGFHDLLEWYVIPDSQLKPADILASVVVVTRWSNDDQSWEQVFLLIKPHETWLISASTDMIDVYNK